MFNWLSYFLLIIKSTNTINNTFDIHSNLFIYEWIHPPHDTSPILRNSRHPLLLRILNLSLCPSLSIFCLNNVTGELDEVIQKSDLDKAKGMKVQNVTADREWGESNHSHIKGFYSRNQQTAHTIQNAAHSTFREHFLEIGAF